MIQFILGWITAGEVPEYKLFTEEPKAKRNRRHKRYSKEAREAAEIKNESAKQNDLAKQMMQRHAERAQSSNSFFEHLMSKYGGVDESEDYCPPKKKTKKSTVKSEKNSVRNVKNGKIKKTK